MDRLAMLQQFVAQKPDDPFARYGLAMELKKRGLLAQANAAFVELMSRHPTYVPAYLMAGKTLLAGGDSVGPHGGFFRGVGWGARVGYARIARPTFRGGGAAGGAGAVAGGGVAAARAAGDDHALGELEAARAALD